MTEHAITALHQSLDIWPENEIASETFTGYTSKLKGRLYGLLCEREKGGKWESFLDSIIVELLGLAGDAINWWALIGKLSALRFLSYEYFRKTIFECMNLVGNLEKQ